MFRNVQLLSARDVSTKIWHLIWVNKRLRHCTGTAVLTVTLGNSLQTLTIATRGGQGTSQGGLLRGWGHHLDRGHAAGVVMVICRQRDVEGITTAQGGPEILHTASSLVLDACL